MRDVIIVILLLSLIGTCFGIDYGHIEITTVPTEECFVYLDNIAMGTTPLKIRNVGVGTHLVEVLRNNQAIFNSEVRVLKDKVTPIKINIPLSIPISIPTGEIETSSEVAGLGVSSKEGESIIISAEPRIRKLVMKEKSDRELASNAVIGVGIAWLVWGLLGEERYRSTNLSMGITFVGMGLWAKLWKSDLEQAYEEICKISDQTEEGRVRRARAAEAALEWKAKKERDNRQRGADVMMFWGCLYTATVVGAAIGLPMIGLAMYEYNAKSDYEKEYDAYLEEKERAKGGVLRK